MCILLWMPKIVLSFPLQGNYGHSGGSPLSNLPHATCNLPRQLRGQPFLGYSTALIRFGFGRRRRIADAFKDLGHISGILNANIILGPATGCRLARCNCTCHLLEYFPTGSLFPGPGCHFLGMFSIRCNT